MIDPKTLTPPQLYKINKTAQRCYISVSAFEYFSSILLSGAFLAALLTKIGVSDAAVGIVSALTSFGVLGQIFALFFGNRIHSAKRIVVTLHVIAQMMFTALYLVPFIRLPQALKTALFIILYITPTFVKMFIHPFRTNWAMSYVSRDQHGSFTATNEIISLIGGMAFTWVMGSLIDYYDFIGQSETGFLLCCGTILGLSLMILFCYLPMKELTPPQKTTQHTNVKETLQTLFANKAYLKTLGMDVLWYTATSISVPFFGTYVNNELGISLASIAIISAVGSVVRVLVSKPLGRYADRTSRSKLLLICFSAAALSFVFMTLSVPLNGLVMYTIYVIVNAVYAAGVNNGVNNIIFDYVPAELCTNAFAVKGLVGGSISIIATFIGAAVVSAMQKAGNTLFGIAVYPQQLLSFVTCLLFIVLVFYVKNIIAKLKRIKE